MGDKLIVDKTWKPTVAGILDVISGLLLVIGVVLFVLVLLGFSVGFGTPTGLTLVRLWLVVMALGLLGLIDIVGGIMSLRRKKWVLALIGSLCAVPAGLGIVATALIALSRREFE